MNKNMLSKVIKSIIIVVAVALVFWILPNPEELTFNAWHFLGIFLVVIVGLILEPLI